ncbi:MAG: hypothetical protein V4574_02985 [Pseudomonadota bacterium]
MIYFGYGLAIRSAVDIPGAIALGDDDPSPVDIDIVEGEAAIDAPERSLGPYKMAGGRLLFEMPGVARYLCDRGGTLTIERMPGAADSDVSGYLIATALPAMLWLRGETVLHAAAAMLPGADAAFAIAGPSGSGKSTILHQLVRAGALIVADDTLCLRMTDDGIEGSGLPAGYFLGRAPRAFLDLEGGSGLFSAPLAGLAVLDLPRTDSAPEIERLRGLPALEALIANRHRPRVPKLLGVAPQQLAHIARLATQLAVHRWRRREGAPALTEAELTLLSGG